MSVQERVARGAAWLGEVSPGWRDALELGTLELADGGRCVLGQVFSDEAARSSKYGCGYTYAMNVLIARAERLDCPDWPSAHGFDSRQSLVFRADAEEALEEPQDVGTELAALEAEWRRMIHVPRDEFASPVLSR